MQSVAQQKRPVLDTVGIVKWYVSRLKQAYFLAWLVLIPVAFAWYLLERFLADTTMTPDQLNDSPLFIIPCILIGVGLTALVAPFMWPFIDD